jgi:hypothetical protein
MKPANPAAQLAAAETELACLKMALAQVKEDREELRQERDDWRREAEMLYAAKLIAAKLREADEGASLPWSAAHGGDAAQEIVRCALMGSAQQPPKGGAGRRTRLNAASIVI